MTVESETPNLFLLLHSPNDFDPLFTLRIIPTYSTEQDRANLDWINIEPALDVLKEFQLFLCLLPSDHHRFRFSFPSTAHRFAF